MKKITLATFFIGILSFGTASAAPFSISMVGDNDFAIFSGTSTSINNLLYQNNVDWPNQITSLSTLVFNLAAGDNKFYVLGMGGGGPEENISGVVNGVNMTDPSVSVMMSSNLSSFLTGYNSNLSAVAGGTYNVLLADVQNVFSSLSWSSAASNLNSTQSVIVASGFGSGFRFNTGAAHLFSFDAQEVNVEPVPEPSIVALLGLALAGLGVAARRRKYPA